MRLLLFSLISLFCSLAVAENKIYITQIGDSDDTEINISQKGDDNIVELSMNHDDNILDFDQEVTGTSTGSNIISWVTYWGSGLSWGGDLDGTGNQIKIKHYDLFRIKNKRDTNDLNIFEKDKNLITFVEWPQLIKDNQEKVIELRFNYENELNNRIIEIIGID